MAIKSFDYYEIGEGAQRRRSVKIVFHDKLKALDKLGAATGAFRKHNKGIDEVRQNVVILVNTGIPGAPGSLVRRTEPNFATLPEKT